MLSKYDLFSKEIVIIQCGNLKKRQMVRLDKIYKIRMEKGKSCLLMEATLITVDLDWSDEAFLPATVRRRESQIIKKGQLPRPLQARLVLI